MPTREGLKGLAVDARKCNRELQVEGQEWKDLAQMSFLWSMI